MRILAPIAGFILFLHATFAGAAPLTLSPFVTGLDSPIDIVNAADVAAVRMRFTAASSAACTRGSIGFISGVTRRAGLQRAKEDLYTGEVPPSMGPKIRSGRGTASRSAPGRHRRARAASATSTLERVANFAQQDGVLGGRRWRRRFRAPQPVDLPDHDEDDEGQDQEVDADGEEVSPGEKRHARLG